jgi:outer membrane protein assembly factor BamB
MRKKVYIKMFVIIFWVTLSNCKKDSAQLIGRNDSIELVWKRELFDKNGAYSINPILNTNNDILMSALYPSNGESEVMKLYDGKTGVKKWEWQDYLRHEENFMKNAHSLDGSFLVLCSHNATYALNIITGQTEWKHFMNPGYGPGSPFVFKDDNGYVYHSFYGEDGDYKNYILRTKFDNLNWELVCSIADSTSSFDRMYTSNITFGQSNVGDDLMFFSSWFSNNPNEIKVLLSCYNLTKSKYEWEENFSSKFNAWGSPQMKVVNGKLITYAYYGAEYNLIGVDIDDGSLSWSIPLPDFGVDLIPYKGNIISFCNRSSPVIAVNASNGSIAWEQTFSKESFSNFNFKSGDAVLFKNYLLSTQCDNLLVLNADNGNIVYNKKVAIEDGCLQYGVAINETDRTFYVQDRKYVCCYKLPSEIKY